jgi:malate dehydrogenase (oxaloacetate-decarboxylating)(NADP+)
LGDLGVNGMGISIGKLSLYIAGAGYVYGRVLPFLLKFIPDSIRPESTIPICLDLGTNNQKFLDDPFYLGNRHQRVSDKEMEEFMDEFMHEMFRAFPKLMVQFEVSYDFILRLQCTFNAQSGFLNGQRIQVP